MRAPDALAFETPEDPGELVETLLREGLPRWPLDRSSDRPNGNDGIPESLVDLAHGANGLHVGPASDAKGDVADPEDVCERVCRPGGSPSLAKTLKTMLLM